MVQNNAVTPATDSSTGILVTDVFKLPLPLRILKLMACLLLADVGEGGTEYIVIYLTLLQE